MTYAKNIFTRIVLIYLCSLFHAILTDQACDKSKCKGPLKYYEDLKCIPTYSAEDSCCPIKFNCDHLKGRSVDKCYYNGHVYAIGERLREGDARPCDIGCTCNPGYKGPAHFSCAIVDCFNRPEPGCYLKRSFNKCCPGPQVCPRNDTKIAQCEVDGKTYLDGQQFTPESDPTQNCICSEGYTGENVSPFCKPHDTGFTCNVELRHATDIFKNCTPTFSNTQTVATDCNYSSRCQNDDDRVIPQESGSATTTDVPPVDDPSLLCIFGNLTMKIGDQLNSGTYYSSVCQKCICEVPPIPSCQQLRDDECDITVHREFEHYSK